MALDAAALASTLRSTFQRARDEAWSSDQVADALAQAIAAFVQGADVTGVVVSVRDTGGNPVGAGEQTNTVHPS